MRASKYSLACLALGLAAPATAQASTQTIQLSNFKYTPATINLKAGEPVTLNFVNAASGGHDFTADKFFAASRITAGAAPHGKIQLHAHESKSVTLIPATGTYAAHCSHFMHSTFGMTGQIVVR